MIRCMLDTNVCIEVIRGRGAKVIDRLRQLKVGEAAISAVTLAELEHGVEKSSKPDQNRIALSQFCAPFELLPFDAPAATAYGVIRANLERHGRIIGPMDLLIAAHALALGCILVTNNLREFRRVKGLELENWF